MSKSIYIPKGQECRMINLTCENLVVDGNLHVDGEIRTKHIRGNGFIYASAIFAKTVTLNTLDCGMISTGRLIAEHVTAVDIHVTGTMSVSIFAKAMCVKTGKVRVADAEIQNMRAETYLPPKRRSSLGYRFTSKVQAILIARRCRLSQRYITVENATEDNDSTTDTDASEIARLLDDPEFLRLKAMYKLTQEMGYIWMISPKHEPTARAVTLADKFTATGGNAA